MNSIPLIVRLATNRPVLIYILTAMLAVLAATQLPRIHIDTDPQNMLPETQADRVYHSAVETRFNLHDALVVGIVNETNANGIYNPQSLANLHALSQSILGMEGVVRPDVMSLATVDNISQQGPGTIRFEWMMNQAPKNAARAAEIQRAVSRLPLLNNTLVSGDGKAAVIYVPLSSKSLSYPISESLREQMDAFSGDDEFHIAGLPVAEESFGHEMFVQMGISAPLAGLVIFLLMAWFFRNLRLITVPMIVAMATVIITMGVLIGLGFTVHIMSSMIPIFLMPIAVVDSVHILSEFADRYHPGDDRREVIRRVVGHLFKPMLFTSVTSAIGFASLLLTPIPPVQVFGAFVAFGILLAFVLTIVLVPAWIVRSSEKQLANLKRLESGASASSLLARSVRKLGRFAVARPWPIIAFSLILLVVSIGGVMHIQINDNPVRWFKESHPIRISDQVLNRHFAGTYDAFLVLEHEDPDVVKALQVELSAQSALLNRYPGLKQVVDDLEVTASASDLDQIVMRLDDALFDANLDDEPQLLALMQAAERSQSALRYFQTPKGVALIEQLQGVLMDTGDVGKTSALADAIKVVNRELRSGQAADYRVPDSQPAIAQTLLQYQSSHRPDDLWHMVTPNYDSAAIWLQLRSGDNQDMSRIVDSVRLALEATPLPDTVQVNWAGKTFINVVWQDAMVSGMLRSLLGAFVVVFVMMTLLFRSLRYGLLAMIPLALTILCAYGLIGWMGKDYDMPIAVLSSLSLGLSIDFAIHFIQRFRDIQALTGDVRSTLGQMFEEPARAISRNAVVIGLGFSPLFLAPLMPYVTVATFMVLIMLLSAMATLLMLPALLRLLIRSPKPNDSGASA